MSTEPLLPNGPRGAGKPVALVLGCALLIVGAVHFLSGTHAPPYERFPLPPKIAGRTEREWEDLFVRGQSNRSDSMENQLAPHGADLEPVLPLLIKALEKPDPVPVRYQFETGPVDLEARRRELASYRIPILGVLERIGPKAKSAVPVLCQQLTHRDSPVRVAAVRALLVVDPGAPGLDDALLANWAAEDASGPKPLAAAVKGKGPQFVARAEAVLIAGTADWDRALVALADTGADPFAALVGGLKSADAPARQNAVRGLNRLLEAARARGNPARELPPFVTVLEPVLADSDAEVRRRAFAALSQLPDQWLPARAFAKGIEDADPGVRALVLAHMRTRPELVEPGADRLRALVRGANGPEAVRAALLLLRPFAKRTADDREAARALVRAVLAQDRPDVSDDLRECIGLLELNDSATVTALTKLLARPDVPARRLACDALGVIGAPARASAPELVAALRASLSAGGEYPETEFRIAACKALAALAPTDPDTVRVLVESFEDRQNVYGAATALLTVGPSTVPALRKALADKDPNVATGAVATLKYFGPDAAPAVPDLIELLRNSPSDLTIDALAWIGAPAAEPLAELLRNKSPHVRRSAAEALARMGPEAGAVRPALERARRDPEVADWAERAIRRAGPGEGSADNWEIVLRYRAHPAVESAFHDRAKRLLVLLRATDSWRVPATANGFWARCDRQNELERFVSKYLEDYWNGRCADLDIAIRLCELVRRQSTQPVAGLDRLAWHLAHLYARADRYADAVALFKGVVPHIPKDGPDDRELALAEFGRSLLAVRAFADAEPVLRELHALRARTEPDEWTAFNAKAMLGIALLGLDKRAEALPLLEAGYAGLKARAEDIPRHVRRERLEDALRALVRCAEREAPTKSAAWRAELDALPPALAPRPRPR